MLCLLLFLHLLMGVFLHRSDNTATTLPKCKFPHCFLPNLWCKNSGFDLTATPSQNNLPKSKWFYIGISIQCPQFMMHKPCSDPITRLPPHSKISKMTLTQIQAHNTPTYDAKLCSEPTACSPPHSKIFYPNHIVSDIDLRLQQPQLMMQNFCFVQDKTPKAFWLYHLLICYIPHFYHLWRGIPYPTKMGPSTVACGQSLWGLSQKGLRALDPIELW